MIKSKLLIVVLRVLYLWPLYCVSFTFGHCSVCPLLLAIVLCVLTKEKDTKNNDQKKRTRNTMIKSKGHAIQWPKIKDTKYNGQK
jgi:transketolase N-terminal domain/subunit